MISNFFIENWFEIVAALLAISYLFLAMRQDAKCWVAWILSSLMYLFVMYSAGLYMEAALQIFYLIIGFYGLYEWKYAHNTKAQLTIKIWSFRKHSLVLSFLFFLVISSGYILANNTNAASPYVDAFTTWGAIIASYMVAKKILENWIYWILADIRYIPLFVYKELYVTSLQYLIFLALAISGYFLWRKKIKNEKN